jgi:hypothetical protein
MAKLEANDADPRKISLHSLDLGLDAIEKTGFDSHVWIQEQEPLPSPHLRRFVDSPSKTEIASETTNEDPFGFLQVVGQRIGWGIVIRHDNFRSAFVKTARLPELIHEFGSILPLAEVDDNDRNSGYLFHRSGTLLIAPAEWRGDALGRESVAQSMSSSHSGILP